MSRPICPAATCSRNRRTTRRPRRAPRPARPASPATAPTASASPPTIRPSPASTRTTSSARCTTTRGAVARIPSWAAWPRLSRPRTSRPSPLTTPARRRRSKRYRRRPSASPRWSRRRRASSPLFRRQLLLEEGHHRLLVEVAVGLLAKAMPLVLGREVPHLAAACAHLRHQLLRFAGWNARIVESLHHQQRPADARGVGQRRDPL